mmetsp:Transcript_41177/g.98613  ORF Transcript_41177/g.98613 Transcript_41177/m.98613 type:complete len:161 (+) Transcript_41177:60-542(+)
MVDHTITASPSFSSRKRQRQRQRQRRRLWLTREEQELSMKTGQHQPLNSSSDDGKNDDDDDDGEDDASLSYDRIFDEFSILPPHKSLIFFFGNTIVVGQEFVLTGLFLAGHRAAIYEEERWDEQQQQQQQPRTLGHLVIRQTGLVIKFGMVDYRYKCHYE